MSEDHDHSLRLIAGLRAGDPVIEHEFWNLYGAALHRLADRYLAAGLRQRLGPEDVVQSACRSFLRRARDGQLQLDDCAALWRVLCAITLTKVREQARYHRRQKRGIDREATLDTTSEDSAAFEPVSPGPTPDEVVAFADQLEHLLAGLDEEEKLLVEHKLQGYTNEEVAERLRSSERTVRRVLQRVKARLARQLEGEEV